MSIALIVGSGFIVTSISSVFVHPFASVPVTTYEVVTEGEAVTEAPVVALKPVEGVHV